MAFRWPRVLVAVMAAFVIAVLGFAAIMVSIRSGLQHFSDDAVARFPGGRIQALIAVVDCDTCAMADRNHAVWALGQMEAKPALATLRNHYDGQKCTHETRLCQHEVRKAIRMIETRRQRVGPVWEAIRRLHQPWG